MAKRLLITGGLGFIGHHLIEGVLKNTDWEIVVLDSLNYAGNMNRLKDIDVYPDTFRRVKLVFHDLRASLTEMQNNEIGKIDYVWHLAAESHVDRSLENAVPFAMSNVVGTTNLLEYVKNFQKDIEKFACFSTDEVFGPAPEGIYYKEEDACNPSNPYSASKEGEEAMCKAFAFSFGLPIMITRTMNVLGERQHPEKFIPKTVRAIIKGEKVVVHGTPKIGFSSRCWIHARTIESALRYLMDNGEIIEKKYQNNPGHGCYHVVGEERDVKYLANRISNVVNNKELDENQVEYVNFHQTRPGHDFRYALSGDKLKALGWKPDMSFDDSFDRMIHWMVRPEKKYWLNL